MYMYIYMVGGKLTTAPSLILDVILDPVVLKKKVSRSGNINKTPVFTVVNTLLT